MRMRHSNRHRSILERRQDVAIREPDERVRVAVASQGAERGENVRMQRLREVEQPAASRVEPVREQMAVRRHLVLGVMRMRARLAGRDRGDDRPVA